MYLTLTIGAYVYRNIYWYKYGVHEVHNGIKVHVGLMATLGHWASYTALIKQNLNTKISMETELVVFDDGMPQKI